MDYTGKFTKESNVLPAGNGRDIKKSKKHREEWAELFYTKKTTHFHYICNVKFSEMTSFILCKWLALQKLTSNPIHQQQWLANKYHLLLRFPRISIIALLRTLINDMIWVIR